ncbi:MAG: 50S ribosomal protein L4, partial [Candidatus Cloacimonetes bacterium]|nr:50S ribosomal protein L4 [Candidatus Cloacimonadota bacterium]
VDLNPTIFAAKINEQLMAQAVRVRMINARLGTAKTKGRGEVRGGGKKPWRQKGTGRARHGSIRSPLWVGGGHIHPLRPRDFSLKMSRKMKRLALFSALTKKLAEGKIFILDKLTLPAVKTKQMAEILQKLPIAKKVLLVIPEKDEKIELSARNLPKKKTLEARLLNTYDVLNYESVVIIKDSLKVIEKTFIK